MHRAKQFRVLAILLMLSIPLAACSGGHSGAIPALSRTPINDGAVPASSLGPTSLQSFAATSEPIAAASGGEMAHSADSLPGDRDADNNFIDSIGVNTKLDNGAHVYMNYPAVKATLLDLGIRHIRDSLSTQNMNGYENFLVDLAASGIHSLLGLTIAPNSANQAIVNVTGAQAAAYLQAGHFRQSVEAVEGINEPDVNQGAPSGPSPSGWVSVARTQQKELYEGIASLTWPARRVPVYGPSVAVRDLSQIGSLSSYLDYGNVHDYSGGWDLPGATVTSVVSAEQQLSGTKPVVASENGYSTGTTGQGLPPLIALDYTQRLFFKQFTHGIRRTYWYELLDQTAKANDYWNNTGLLTSSFAHKPAYTGLKNIIALLKDPTPYRTRTALNFSFGGVTQFENIEHLLLQKNDGSFWLIVWRDVNEWIPARNGEPGTAPDPVPANIPNTLDILGTYVASVTQYTENWTGEMSATRLAVTNGSSARITIASRPTILKIVPGTAPTRPPAPVISNPAAHWSLNEGAGLVAADSVNAADNLVIPGGGLAHWLAGEYGAGLSFDGTQATSKATTALSAVDTTKSYSATAWLELNGESGYQAAFAVNGYNQAAFALDFTPQSHLSFTTYTDDSASSLSTRVGSNITPQIGTWYAVAATYDSATRAMSFYVNGVLQSTGTARGVFRARGGVEIGSMLQGGVGHFQWWNGSVDEINLYQRVLTASEVRAMAGR